MEDKMYLTENFEESVPKVLNSMTWVEGDDKVKMAKLSAFIIQALGC